MGRIFGFGLLALMTLSMLAPQMDKLYVIVGVGVIVGGAAELVRLVRKR